MDLILWTWVLIIKFSIQVETSIQVVAVQPLSRIRLFVTPWSAAHQALLSFAVSQSLLQFASICQWCCLTISPSVTPFKYLGLFLGIHGCAGPGAAGNIYCTHRKDGERGWVRFKVCVCLLLSVSVWGTSFQAAFYWTFHLFWQGLCYILDFLLCVPLQALWLRITRERMLGQMLSWT